MVFAKTPTTTGHGTSWNTSKIHCVTERSVRTRVSPSERPVIVRNSGAGKETYYNSEKSFRQEIFEVSVCDDVRLIVMKWLAVPWINNLVYTSIAE